MRRNRSGDNLAGRFGASGRSNPRLCGPVGEYRLDQTTGSGRCIAMRKAVLIFSIMSCALVGADARGRHHHGHHFDMYLEPGADTPSTQRQSPRRSGRERLAVVASTDHLLAERSIDTAQIVPRDWHLESPTQTATGNVLYRRMGRRGSSGTGSRPGTNRSPLT